jgi:hypothetical protein
MLLRTRRSLWEQRERFFHFKIFSLHAWVNYENETSNHNANIETAKRIFILYFLESGYMQYTAYKLDKWLHFMPVFVARQFIIGLTVQYVYLDIVGRSYYWTHYLHKDSNPGKFSDSEPLLQYSSSETQCCSRFRYFIVLITELHKPSLTVFEPNTDFLALLTLAYFSNLKQTSPFFYPASFPD